MKKNIKKIFTVSLISIFFVQAFYMLIEPSLASAVATDAKSVVVTLGVTSGLSLTGGGAITMTPNISMSANKSMGSSSVTAITNSVSGYTLALKASTSPALKGTAPNVDSFTDYSEAVLNTPDLWGGVASGTKEFGFSAYGANVPTATWGVGVTDCGVPASGAPNAAAKYMHFTTSDLTVASLGTVTPTTGVVTNICFEAEQNGIYAASGAYTATITATMTAS